MNSSRPTRPGAFALCGAFLLVIATDVMTARAQDFYGGYYDDSPPRTAREAMPRSYVLPAWKNPTGFGFDVFTFARVVFRSDPRRYAEGGWGGGRGGRGWAIDFPDADLNFSHRLQQMTSTAVDPDGRAIRLNDSDLTDYPFIFMLHIERLAFDPDEVVNLRNYLLNGGALLVNDFWGELAWRNFEAEMKKVLPGRSWTPLDFDHPIFRIVFPIKGPMSSLRVPTIHRWNQNYQPGNPESNPTDRPRGEGYETMHIRALHDDRGRIVAVAIHNSDVSDGWEREGENADYFKTFSEPRAYPLGINIITYFMTH